NDAEIWYKLAKEYEKLHQWEEAANSLTSYLKLNPQNSRVSFQLAECYRKISDFQRAETNYQQATKNLDNKNVGQDLAISLYRLGLMQQENGNPEQAYKSFEKATYQDKELNSLRFGIGAFHEKYGHYNYAIEAYKERLSQND